MTQRLLEEATMLLRAVPLDAMPADWNQACGRLLDALDQREATPRPSWLQAWEIPSAAVLQFFAAHPTPDMEKNVRRR